MGQFEKIVVLLSFFLVTVILVISFSSDEKKHYPMGPADDEVAAADLDRLSAESSEPAAPSFTEPMLGGEAESLSGEPELLGLQARRDREARETEGTEGGEVPDLLLDSAGPSRAASGTRGATLPAGAALITLEGLTDTFEAEIKEYVWQRGDTFVSVARRFYGEAEKSRLLRQFNEDVSYKAPGDKILLPVFDRRSAAAVATGDGSPTILSGTRKGASGTPYRVVDGDSLWVISKKVYGKGSLWERIFEANTDQLESPDDLTTGQLLRIP